MNQVHTWLGILVVAFASVVGDVLLARAMREVGDVHDLWRRDGLWSVVSRVLSNPNLSFGVAAMAVAFFSLLFTLSWGDVSLVAPAAGTASAWPDAVRANLNNGQGMKNF